MTDFPALQGVYRLLFLYIEPVSTIIPFFTILGYPGSKWFYEQLAPGSDLGSGPLDARADMAVWQLGNCYLLLGLLSSFVFRAVRDALPNNPAAQERIIGAAFLALGIADITHILVTARNLPAELLYRPLEWNAMTQGNITTPAVLLGMRTAWYLGVGRSRPWASQKSQKEL